MLFKTKQIEYECALDLLNGISEQDIIHRIKNNLPHPRLNKSVVEEGLLTCRVCKSKKIKAQSKQLRSSDEGMSVVCHCSECFNYWVESG